MSFEEPEQEWKILYRDAWGEPKSIGLIFPSYKSAVDFALQNKLKNFFICKLQEFYSYLEMNDQCREAELAWWHSRVARPYHENIELIEEEPEIRDVAPRTNFVSIVPKKVSLFRPNFAGTPKRKMPIEESDDVTYYESSEKV